MFFQTKTHFYARLTDKEQAINLEECSHNNERYYSLLFTALYILHSLIIIDTVPLTNNSESTLW